jgi:Ca-activated chloride channel family protein
LPKGDLASQRVKRPHERYQWLLGLALVLLVLEFYLPERPALSPSVAPGATAVSVPPAGAKVVGSSAGLLVVIALFGLGALPSARASSAEGLKQYERGNFDRALAEYERLLARKPDDARLHFNAGTTAFQNKNYEQALSHLTSALVTPDLLLQQRAYYNIGNTLFRLGEGESDPEQKRSHWQRAISNYESVLKLEPKDADAEFNRELVKRRLEQLKSDEQQKDKEKEPPSEAAKKAKSQADEAVRRRDYRAALEIMESQLKIDSTTSYYAEYIQRLRQINGISTPAAASGRPPQSLPQGP